VIVLIESTGVSVLLAEELPINKHFVYVLKKIWNAKLKRAFYRFMQQVQNFHQIDLECNVLFYNIFLTTNIHFEIRKFLL